MRLTTSFLAVIWLLVGYSSAGPSRDANRNSGYCSVDPGHTMCTRPAPQQVGEENGLKLWNTNVNVNVNGEEKCDIKFRDFTSVGADSILKRVNKRRNEVAGGNSENMNDNPQPSAANMRRLTWNWELANIAQRWADQCIIEDKGAVSVHDNGHRATLDGVWTGQNGYIGSFSRQILDDEEYTGDDYGDGGDDFGDLGDDWRVRRSHHSKHSKNRVKRKVFWDSGYIDEVSASTFDQFMVGIGNFTDAWFNEYKKFDDPSHIASYKFVYKTGHYSQEMWAKSSEIGCGWNFFSRGLREGGEFEDYTLLMHCNFKTGGNQEGKPIYEEGDPATACGEGYKPDEEYKNLCSKK